MEFSGAGISQCCHDELRAMSHDLQLCPNRNPCMQLVAQSTLLSVSDLMISRRLAFGAYVLRVQA
jgi:hypothetical protein